jgi:hypothetical protein
MNNAWSYTTVERARNFLACETLQWSNCFLV